MIWDLFQYDLADSSISGDGIQGRLGSRIFTVSLKHDFSMRGSVGYRTSAGKNGIGN